MNSSLLIKTAIFFLFPIILQSCSQLFTPGGVMIDSLLSEQKITQLLTAREWLDYKYLDPYTLGLPSKGTYSSGTGRVLQLDSNGKFNEKTNSLFPELKAQGKWRFIKAQRLDTARFQKEERYNKIIQGTLVLLDSISNPQRFNTTRIDTLKEGFPIIFVSNEEFFWLIPSIHGSVSWYFRLK